MIILWALTGIVIIGAVLLVTAARGLYQDGGTVAYAVGRMFIATAVVGILVQGVVVAVAISNGANA